MRILLVAATLFEIRPFLEKLPLSETPGEYLSRYQYHDVTIDVLIPGVGMVSTAYHLGRQLALQHYDMAINAGIAGTFNKSLPLGSVLNIVEDSIPELGAEDGENFISIFELGLTDPDAHPFKGGRLINNSFETSVLRNNGELRKLPQAKAITSNTVRGNAFSIARIQRIAGADIESMEGAAFLFACLTEKTPCLQIRSVSNRVEERDKARWNLDLALKNLNRALWKIITFLPVSD